jgi:DNA-binding response OmpR family regulator
MKVVLVDDEIKFVTMLAKRMKLRGFDAYIATDGDQALKLASDIRFDVAVLDIKMPGMGGVELKEKLSQISKDIQFIFVTGHGAVENSRAHLEHGDIYLSKPLDIEILIETIKKMFP